MDCTCSDYEYLPEMSENKLIINLCHQTENSPKRQLPNICDVDLKIIIIIKKMFIDK